MLETEELHHLALIYLQENKTAKERLRELRAKREKLLNESRVLRNGLFRETNEFSYASLMLTLIYLPRMEEQQEQVNKEIKFLEWESSPNPGPGLDIERAKQRPITDFMQFNRAGFAKCLWHEPDKHPSMKYDKKRNRLHCFACGIDKDVIDTLQQLNHWTFAQTVKFLTNK